MNQFDVNYDKNINPYQPYASTGQGGPDLAMMFMSQLSRSVNRMPGGGTYNSPFNNIRDQSSAMSHDKVYQDMVAAATERYRGQVSEFLQAGPNALQQWGGQPITASQQAGYAMAAQVLLTGANQGAMTTPLGRQTLDMFAGGANILNTQLAYAQNYKKMFDPLTGMPTMSSESVLGAANAADQYLFGDGRGMANMRVGRFGGADMLPTMNYLTSQGAFADSSLESKMLSNPTTMAAIQSGAISAADLERMGVGDLSQMVNADTDPGAAAAMRQSIGRRGGRVVEDTMAAANAISELIGPELIDGTEDLMNRLQEFTQRYNRQLSGKVQGGLIREMKHTFGEMGRSYEDMQAIQDYAAQNLAQQGYRGGATPYVVAETGAIIQGLNRMESFGQTTYGARDIGEMTQQTIKDMGDYGKSRRASMLATIAGVAEDNGMQFTDDDAGHRAEKLVRNLMAGAPIGDPELEGMDATQLAEFAASGMAGTGNHQRILEEAQNALLSETRGKKYRIDSRMQEDRRADLIAVSRDYIGAQSFGELADSSDPAGANAFLSQLGESMATGGLGMTDAEAADEETRKKYMGSQLLRTLQQQIESGDPVLAAQAQQALDQLGSTPEEQQLNANKYGARFLNDAMAARQEPWLDTLRQMGDASIAAANAGGNEAKVKGFVDGLLQNTTNQSPMDAIKGLANYLTSQGDQDVTGLDLEKAIDSTFSTQASPEIRKQMAESLTRVQELQADLLDTAGGDPQDEALRQHREQQHAALAKETEFLRTAVEDRAGKEPPPTPEQAAAAATKAAAESAAAGSSAGGAGSVVLNNVTFVIGDEFMVQVNKQLSSKTLPNSTGNV